MQQVEFWPTWGFGYSFRVVRLHVIEVEKACGIAKIDCHDASWRTIVEFEGEGAKF